MSPCLEEAWGGRQASAPTERSLPLLVLRSLDLVASGPAVPAALGPRRAWVVCLPYFSPRPTQCPLGSGPSHFQLHSQGLPPNPCSLCCFSQYCCQPSLTDQLCSAPSGSLRAFTSPPAASQFPWAQRGTMYGVYVKGMLVPVSWGISHRGCTGPPWPKQKSR